MNRRTVDRSVSNFATAWTVNNPPYVILKWSIENFSSAVGLFRSPCFDVSPTSKWNLLLDPNVVVNEDVFVEIHLRKNSKSADNSARFLLKGEMTIHGPDNELIFDQLFEEIHDPVLNNSIDFRIAKVCFSLKPSECDRNDTYLIRCEMVLSHELNTTDEWRPHLEKLSCDLKRLYEDKRFTDTNIRAGNDTIRTHKAILHARSSVLSDILDASIDYISEEDQGNICLASILLFVYTGDPDLLLASVPVEMFGKIALIAKKWELSEIENILSPLKMHCKTRIKHDQFLYTWKIKNFSKLHFEDARDIHSPEFAINDETQTRWKLILERSILDNADTYGLYIVKAVSDNLSHKVSLEFCVYSCKNNSVTRRREFVFGPRNNQRHGFSTLLSRNFVQTAVSNDDTLNVECRLKIHLDSESWISFKHTNIDVSDKDTYSIKYLKTLSHNMKDLYEKEKYADLKICGKNDMHNVHRAVMWARSPYFCDILSRYSAEYISVPIEDHILIEVLLYMYSAKLPKLDLQSMQKIYEASILLKIDELRLICNFYILQHITIDNVLEILVLAHKYGNTELENAAERFASTRGNAKMIINTTRWRIFCRRYTEFGMRIYHNLAAEYCSNS